MEKFEVSAPYWFEPADISDESSPQLTIQEPWELEPETAHERALRLKTNRPKIVRTFLSYAPVDGGAYVSFFILAVAAIFSLLQWNPSSHLNFDVSMKALTAQGEWWRLLSAQFAHADPAHLLSNMASFFVFTYFLYGYFGAKPVGLGFLAGAVANYLTVRSYEPDQHLLGLSGTVYALAGMWLVLYVLVERRYSFFHRFFRVLAFTLIVLVPSTYEANISYLCHFYGFVAGGALAIPFFFIRKSELRAKEKWGVRAF